MPALSDNLFTSLARPQVSLMQSSHSAALEQTRMDFILVIKILMVNAAGHIDSLAFEGHRL